MTLSVGACFSFLEGNRYPTQSRLRIHSTTNAFMKDLNFERKTERRRANTASMRNIVAGFCRTAMEDYRAAGYPFGKTTEGMLIWFEHGQMTTPN